MSGSQTQHSESSVFSVEQLAVEKHDNTVLLPGCGSSLMEDLTGNEMELGKYCNLWTDTVNTTWEECFLSVRPTETEKTEKHTEKHNILFTSLIFRKMDIVRLREKNSKYIFFLRWIKYVLLSAAFHLLQVTHWGGIRERSPEVTSYFTDSYYSTLDSCYLWRETNQRVLWAGHQAATEDTASKHF